MPRNNSGNLAMPAAIRRDSSRGSRLVAVRLPGKPTPDRFVADDETTAVVLFDIPGRWEEMRRNGHSGSMDGAIRKRASAFSHSPMTRARCSRLAGHVFGNT